MTFGPKPDEGNASESGGAKNSGHELFEDAIDGLVHGPAREGSIAPVFQGEALQVFSNGNRQERPNAIVGGADQRASVPGSGREGAAIAFVAEVLNDLIRIKGKNAGVVLELWIDREIHRQISRLGKSPAARQGAEANLIAAEAKETRGQGQGAGEPEINKRRRTTKILEKGFLHWT